MPNVQKVKASVTADRVAKLKKEDPEKYGSLPEGQIGPVEIEYDFGANPTEAGQYFGNDVVMDLLNFAISHPIQSKVRSQLAEKVAHGKSVAQATREIQGEIYKDGKHVWKPGLGPTRKSAVEKEADRLKKLSPEQRKAEKEKLLAMLNELG